MIRQYRKMPSICPMCLPSRGCLMSLQWAIRCLTQSDTQILLTLTMRWPDSIMQLSSVSRSKPKKQVMRARRSTIEKRTIITMGLNTNLWDTIQISKCSISHTNLEMRTTIIVLRASLKTCSPSWDRVCKTQSLDPHSSRDLKIRD